MKVCYKVSLCENCQRQSCRALIGLTIHAKIIGGERPFLPEILGQSDGVGAKSQIFELFFGLSITIEIKKTNVVLSLFLYILLRDE